MNRQPYETPPRWWSPRLSPAWIRFWRPFRKYRALWQCGLTGVAVQGVEYLRSSMLEGHGILITPNHPTHADAFALLDAADQLATPLYFMAAWQVFAMTHWLGRRVLRQHGCFSINREGHDLRALRQSVRILESEKPLVIFPEGEVFHLNDRVTHFRRGAATAALQAARRSGRPVACVPCGIKYQYVGDPMPGLRRVMNRLEHRYELPILPAMPLVERIRRFADEMLDRKEREYFGSVGHGSFAERSGTLMQMLLERLEARYRVGAPRAAVPERVKELRRRVIAQRDTAVAQDREQFQADLDDLLFVMQLFSYPAGYLAGQPSLERLAETVDKLEEDFLHVPTASFWAKRQAIISFGEPVLAHPGAERNAATEITSTLQLRVQALLDSFNPEKLPSPNLQTPEPLLPLFPTSNGHPLPEAA